MENEIQKAIERLKDLVLDRQSFIKGESDFDDVFLADIDALRVAISALKRQEEEPKLGLYQHYNGW